MPGNKKAFLKHVRGRGRPKENTGLVLAEDGDAEKAAAFRASCASVFNDADGPRAARAPAPERGSGDFPWADAGTLRDQLVSAERSRALPAFTPALGRSWPTLRQDPLDRPPTVWGVRGVPADWRPALFPFTRRA